MEPTRVLIADDEALIRHALGIFVNSSDDIITVGEAADGEEAFTETERLLPDIVLMDLQMPRVSGIEATQRITATLPEVRVIAVTSFSARRHIVPTLRAGASAFLPKDTDPVDLLEAIRDVRAGRSVISPNATRDLILSLRSDQASTTPAVWKADTLTPRELSIVRLIAQGCSNAEIAVKLHLAEPTIKANLSRVMVKWAVRDRVQVLIYAITNEIVEIDPLNISFTR